MEHSHEEPALPTPCFLAKLPQELVKMILSNLHPPVGSIERKEHRDLTDSLLAAMRSCRTLLHAGRPILYREPVFFDARTKTPLEASSWSYSIYDEPNIDAVSSHSFAQAVANSTVAAFVHDLPRLEFAIRVESGTKLGKDERDRRTEKILRLQNDILTACTQLESVSVVLYNLDQAEHVGSLLAAMPNLSSLALTVLRVDNKYKDFELYATCLKRLAPSGRRVLAKLSLVGYQGEYTEDLDDDGSQDDTPVVATGSDTTEELPLMVSGVTSALAIDLRRSHMQDAIRFYLPDWAHSARDDASGLTAISIKYQWPKAAFTVDSDTVTVLTAPRFKGNRLTTIELEYEDEDAYEGEEPRMDLYASTYGRIAYSSSVLGLFGNARKLRLGMSRGMTLEHLKVLATGSPQLEVFELPGSLWNLTPADLETVSPEQLSAFEQQLIKVLERLTHLRTIDLGFWPYEEKTENGRAVSSRSALQQWASSRDLALKVRGCRSGAGW